MHIIVHNYAMLCTFVHTRCIICEPHMHIILCALCKFHNSFQIQIEVGIKSFSAVSLASWFCVNMGWHAWIRLFHQWIINKCVGCVMVCVRCDIVHACTCSAMPSFWCYPPSHPPCPHGQVGCLMVFKLCTLCYFMHKIMHLLCKIMHLWLGSVSQAFWVVQYPAPLDPPPSPRIPIYGRWFLPFKGGG